MPGKWGAGNKSCNCSLWERIQADRPIDRKPKLFTKKADPVRPAQIRLVSLLRFTSSFHLVSNRRSCEKKADRQGSDSFRLVTRLVVKTSASVNSFRARLRRFAD